MSATAHNLLQIDLPDQITEVLVLFQNYAWSLSNIVYNVVNHSAAVIQRRDRLMRCKILVNAPVVLTHGDNIAPASVNTARLTEQHQ